jgi:hypothetical protein
MAVELSDEVMIVVDIPPNTVDMFLAALFPSFNRVIK